MTKTLTKKAYAKINLSLDVLKRRPDGYHEVRMIMQTVGIYDTLTFSVFKDNDLSGTSIELKVTDKDLDLGPMKKNLIYRAAKMIVEEKDIKNTRILITLKKNIPVAAGMAGGSTDAACVFHGLNELLALGMSLDDMCSLGVKLGADIPYCIKGGCAISEGIGEILTPIAAPPEAVLLIAKPDINVSTKFVYENLHANELKTHPDVDSMIEAISNQDLTKMSQVLGNVLETVTTKEYPVIDKIKTIMKDQGALGALMSGSGPTVFGLFDPQDRDKAKEALKAVKEAVPDVQIFITGFIN